jgi:sugar lactone lactonase YvrE
VLQTIAAELGCFSCALGGRDRRTLYVTAASWSPTGSEGPPTGQILAATVDVPGAGWPG